MQNNDDDNWLEGAFLAQEEYDSDKGKWKGREKEMEDHFLSTYDTLPDTNDYRSGGAMSSDTGVVILVLVILFGALLFGFLVIAAAG